MSNKTASLELIEAYFKEKGSILTQAEYNVETDTPIRPQQIRNLFGSWNRMEKLIMVRARKDTPKELTNVEEILRMRNEQEWNAKFGDVKVEEDLELFEALKKAEEEEALKKAEEEIPEANEKPEAKKPNASTVKVVPAAEK